VAWLGSIWARLGSAHGSEPSRGSTSRRLRLVRTSQPSRESEGPVRGKKIISQRFLRLTAIVNLLVIGAVATPSSVGPDLIEQVLHNFVFFPAAPLPLLFNSSTQ